MGVGVTEGVGVTDGVGVMDGVGVTLGVGVTEGVGVGVGVGVVGLGQILWQKRKVAVEYVVSASVEANIVVGVDETPLRSAGRIDAR